MRVVNGNLPLHRSGAQAVVLAVLGLACALCLALQLPMTAFAGDGLSLDDANDVGVSFDAHGSEFGKAETVAVKTDLTGKLDSLSVKEWIKNPEGLGEISDSSALQNIVAEDDVAFTRDGDAIRWKADGRDVVYTGTSARELPFAIRYTYRLDGVEVDPGTLKGAKGKLEVRIDYENRTSATVQTSSGSYDIKDPFVMASIISFDAEHARNVQVDNGSVVDQQGTTMAVGIGMPGLEQTLDLGDIVELPTSVTVTADVVGFDMPDITTIVTSEALGMVGSDATDDVESKLDETFDQLGNIVEGTEMLAKGNKAVATAMGKISEGSAAMAENLPQATDGLTALAGVATATGEAVSAVSEAQAGIAANEKASKEAQQAAVDSQQAALDALPASISLDGAIASGWEALDKQQGVSILLQPSADEGAGAEEGGGEGGPEGDLPASTVLEDTQASLVEQQAALAALEELRDEGSAGMSDAQKEAVANAIARLESSIAASGSAEAGIADATAQLDEAIGATEETLGALDDDAQALAASDASIDAAKEQLADSAASLHDSLDAMEKNEEALEKSTQGLAAASKQAEGLATGLSGAVEGFGTVQQGMTGLSEALSQISTASSKLGQGTAKLSKGVSEALSTARSTVEEKLDLVEAVRDYVKSQPAYGGSSPAMPATTMYTVHAKGELTPLR